MTADRRVSELLPGKTGVSLLQVRRKMTRISLVRSLHESTPLEQCHKLKSPKARNGCTLDHLIFTGIMITQNDS